MTDIEKPLIEYPTRWTYKLIAIDKQQLRQCVAALMDGRAHELVASRTSRKGSYYSFNLTLEVESESDRDFVYHQLKKQSVVVMVL